VRLSTALRGAVEELADATASPGTVGAIATLYGGNAPLARALLGMAPDRRPRDMSADQRRTYNTTLRNLQRYQKEGGQTRKPKPGQLERLNRAARLRIRENAAKEIRERGVRATFRGSVNVSPRSKRYAGGDERYREPPDQDISGADMAKALDALEEGRSGDAADEFERAFLEAYDMPDDAYITDVDELRLELL
jgi:hypothetical protein